MKMAGMGMGRGDRVVTAMIENSEKWLRLNGRRMKPAVQDSVQVFTAHSWVMTMQTGP